MVAIQ
ncbi:hypothetical protein D030_2936A, partial [Vibrio parahaemolyticus AQ3810]